MRKSSTAAILLALHGFAVQAQAAGCPEGRGGLGVTRIVEIDTTGGPVFGEITKRAKERRFLGPKEVVLTFDDGPFPGVTRSILDTLDRFCTKATFFSVGKMAVAYPELTREILRRGHTLGTHTWSHPMSLPRLKGSQGVDQIESGFAAVALAAGQPIAPFFRFPGLNDSEALVAHLTRRNIATFTVDVVSNDSYIADPGRLIDRTLAQLKAEDGGIALFHDIKPQTARALPTLLAEMRARGYRIVHIRAKAPFAPDERYANAVRQQVATRSPEAKRALLAVTDMGGSPAPAILPEDELQAGTAVTASPEARTGRSAADRRPDPRYRPADGWEGAPPAAAVSSAAQALALPSQAEAAAKRSAASAIAPLGDAQATPTAEATSRPRERPVLKPIVIRRAPSKPAEPMPAVAETPRPPENAKPAAPLRPAIEVIGGNYATPGSSPAGRPLPPREGAGIQPPEVIAGSYAQQGSAGRTLRRNTEPSPTDSLSDQVFRRGH